MNILGKRRTFIVISPRDGQAREYGFFPRVLCLILLGGFGFVGTLGYLVYALGFGFYQPGDQKALLALQDENKTLLHSLEQTREEVQQLGEVMDQLKATEDRLRAHHEMKPLEMEPLAADQEPSGVGGVEDLSAEFTSLPPQKQRMMRELSVRIDHLKRMVNLQAESFEEIERKFEETNVQYLPTILPVLEKTSWLTSPFGRRRDPFTGRWAFHYGVDFAGRRGTPIYATADGFVSYAGKDRYLGNTITLDHRKKELDEQGPALCAPRRLPDRIWPLGQNLGQAGSAGNARAADRHDGQHGPLDRSSLALRGTLAGPRVEQEPGIQGSRRFYLRLRQERGR